MTEAEQASTFKDRAKEKLKSGKEYLRERAKIVDDKVHNNPWPVIGGSFLVGLLLGFILGKNK